MSSTPPDPLQQAQIQRMYFENLKLLSDVILNFINDFGRLIAVLGMLCTLLGNLGWVTFNILDHSTEKGKPAIFTDVSSIDKEKTLCITVPKLSADNVETVIPQPSLHLLSQKKVMPEWLKGANIWLFLSTGTFFLLWLFSKKKVKPESDVVLPPVSK